MRLNAVAKGCFLSIVLSSLFVCMFATSSKDSSTALKDEGRSSKVAPDAHRQSQMRDNHRGNERGSEQRNREENRLRTNRALQNQENQQLLNGVQNSSPVTPVYIVPPPDDSN